MLSIPFLRPALHARAVLAAGLLIGGAANADTGYSDLFTIDLRTSLAGSIRVERIADTRTPVDLVARPGDELALYFTLRKVTGEPISATRFDYDLKLSGVAATAADAVAWSVTQPGVVKLTLKADSLKFSTSPALLDFRQGSGYAQVDGSPVAVDNSLPSVTLSSLSSPYRTSTPSTPRARPGRPGSSVPAPARGKPRSRRPGSRSGARRERV